MKLEDKLDRENLNKLEEKKRVKEKSEVRLLEIANFLEDEREILVMI